MLNHCIVEIKFPRVTIILHLGVDLLKQFSYRATCINYTMNGSCPANPDLKGACACIINTKLMSGEFHSVGGELYSREGVW